MNNKLNRFTTYKYLLATLNNGLYFSDGKEWPDKNDSELLEIFRKYSGKDVTVACLMGEDETIYYWQSFAKDSCLQEVCCIEFDKEKLISLYNDENKKQSNCHYYCKEVDYKSIDEFYLDNSLQLLFTKRLPYRYEKEFRIVSVANKKTKPSKIDIERFKKTITKITLSGKLPDEKYECRKQHLIENYSFSENQINQSTVENNPFWIRKAETQAQFLDYKRDGVMCASWKKLHEEESIKKIDYTAQINKIKSLKGELNSVIVTFCSDNYVVAMGILQLIHSKRKKELKNIFKNSFKFHKSTYELCYFHIRDDYRGFITYDKIIEEFYDYIKNEFVIAVTSNANQGFIDSLKKAKFQAESSNDGNIMFVNEKFIQQLKSL